jgi:hypothetical protein
VIRIKTFPKIESGWLLLILSAPGQQPALRMRLWRGLKALGVGVVRDGVYVLPNRAGLRESLQAQAYEVITAGGTAQVLDVQDPKGAFAALLDRTPDYAGLIKEIQSASNRLKKLKKNELGRTLDKLRRDFEVLTNLDFFPGAAQQQASSAIDALTLAVNQIRAPGEPHAGSGKIMKLNVKDYQGRVWATRKRPWIDRLASAWLIRRFVDGHARIKWLDQPADCPKRALGFDFDGATFSHVGNKVTFEVLAAAFDLGRDPLLGKIGALVHYLDVGGIPVPEAAGFEAIINGVRSQFSNDDEFLSETEKILDFIYDGYGLKQF